MTGISKDDAYVFMEHGDVITACMSKELIEIGIIKEFTKLKQKYQFMRQVKREKKLLN